MGVLAKTAMAVGPSSAMHPEALHPAYAARAARRAGTFNPAPGAHAMQVPLPESLRAKLRGGGNGLLRYAVPLGLAAGTGLALSQLSGLKSDRRLDNLVDAPMSGAY